MPTDFAELIIKNFGILGVGIAAVYLAVSAVWKYFVAQQNKKDETIDAMIRSNNERMAVAIDNLDKNVEESNKLISNLLVLLTERNKL